MRSKLYSLIILLLICSFALEAQINLSVHKKEFRTTKAGFDEAWKHVCNGDIYYNEKGVWFSDAYNEYLQAMVYNTSNAELNYKTGVAALYSDKKEEAASFFNKAFELNKNVAPDILLLTGRSLQYSGNFQSAIDKLTAWLSLPGKKSEKNVLLARQYIQECNSALEVMKDTLRVSIEDLGTNINSSSDDYSEVLSDAGNTMYFASRRQNPYGSRRHPDTKYDENILISLLEANNWMPAVYAGKYINTKLCEAPLFVNPGNNILYVYTGYSGKGDIKMSVNRKGSWRKPQSVPYKINTKGSETSFTISPSGNEIYFVSDKPKNSIGGKDIYYIKKLNERKWTKPQNAGRLVNSIYDEESVRLSRTGDTLWFSSKGHNTIGGFDIFYSTKNSQGAWDSVKNAGYPINTPWDDIFYLPSPVNDSLFYLVSNRMGGYGGLDIYQGKILPAPVIAAPVVPARDTIVIRDTVVIKTPPPAPPVPQPVAAEVQVYLIGKVLDSESGEPVLAKVDLKDLTSGMIITTTASSDIDGSYKILLPAKKSYTIDLKATGYLSDNRRIDVPDNWSKDTYNFNIDLIKVKVGKKVVLNNILFETGKSVLTAGSYVEVDRLLNIMKENPGMKVEISGHTDKTGSEQLNAKLSEARAKTVVDYLIKNNIETTRMSYKGYGSSQPIADNATSAGRTKNRRVEFKILEF